MFKLIVAGSRDFNDYDLVCSSLDKLLQNINDEICIISGAARGADKLGERYALEKGYVISSHPAKWDELGKKAGYIRNVEMAEEGDALALFWDGESKGSKHMYDIAKKYGLKIRVITYK
ncbi:DUF2493 domain-containing protein [Paenibacillaceae bacterium]|nr:DUF2493 domain-containing protein [Paenibacillaceae bacterium]